VPCAFHILIWCDLITLLQYSSFSDCCWFWFSIILLQQWIFWLIVCFLIIIFYYFILACWVKVWELLALPRTWDVQLMACCREKVEGNRWQTRHPEATLKLSGETALKGMGSFLSLSRLSASSPDQVHCKRLAKPSCWKKWGNEMGFIVLGRI